jgi:hypothetical protein
MRYHLKRKGMLPEWHHDSHTAALAVKASQNATSDSTVASLTRRASTVAAVSKQKTLERSTRGKRCW